MRQEILHASENYAELDLFFRRQGWKKILLVCGGSARKLRLYAFLERIAAEQGTAIVKFQDFQPNPAYESTVKGVRLLKAEGCDGIVAVGGGSAIDVAKCIRLFSGMDGTQNYLRQKAVPNDLRLLAVPTTAGSGSEATRYAAIYENGEKRSVTDEGCIPDAVLFDSGALETLPPYQKKSAALDALCHALESFWSVNSTEESRAWSALALREILSHFDAYLSGGANAAMLRAAHTAGKAIDVAQTTAGHAMCYQITSLFGLAHGHAAALCDRKLFRWTLRHTDRCTDPRGRAFLEGVLARIAEAMGRADAEAAAERFEALFDALELPVPAATPAQFDHLRARVHLPRLKNYPLRLDAEDIDSLYHEILNPAE